MNIVSCFTSSDTVSKQLLLGAAIEAPGRGGVLSYLFPSSLSRLTYNEQ